MCEADLCEESEGEAESEKSEDSPVVTSREPLPLSHLPIASDICGGRGFLDVGVASANCKTETQASSEGVQILPYSGL